MLLDLLVVGGADDEEANMIHQQPKSIFYIKLIPKPGLAAFFLISTIFLRSFFEIEEACSTLFFILMQWHSVAVHTS